MRMNKLSILVLVGLFGLAAAWCLALQPATPLRQEVSADLTLDTPTPGDTVSSPLRIEGSARGIWFFEATFPIRLVALDGRELAVGFATALDDWMTTDFVPFRAEVPYAVAAATDALLILEKANPSDLAENAAALTVPVVLSPTEK